MMATSISGQSTMRQPLLTKQEKLLMKPLPMELAGKCHTQACIFLLCVMGVVFGITVGDHYLFSYLGSMSSLSITCMRDKFLFTY